MRNLFACFVLAGCNAFVPWEQPCPKTPIFGDTSALGIELPFSEAELTEFIAAPRSWAIAWDPDSTAYPADGLWTLTLARGEGVAFTTIVESSRPECSPGNYLTPPFDAILAAPDGSLSVGFGGLLYARELDDAQVFLSVDKYGHFVEYIDPELADALGGSASEDVDSQLELHAGEFPRTRLSAGRFELELIARNEWTQRYVGEYSTTP